MTGAAKVTSNTAQSPNHFAGASLPPLREWLTTFELAKEGLYLNQILEQPRLFISDVASAGASVLLSENKIGAILSLVPQPFERMTLAGTAATSLERYRVTQSTHAPYNDPSIARYYISLRDDGTNTPEQLIAAFELLEDVCRSHSESGILVHCQAGISRSVSLVAALVSKSLKCSFEEGVRAVAKHRHVGVHEDFATSLTQALGIPLDSHT
jgi:hypothetical protein